jgi:hypothetical protein
LYLVGDKWHSSITPSLFSLFQSVQAIVNKTYAHALYGNKNKRLTDEAKELLEIVINIYDGSSKQSADYAKILERIAKKMVGKMTGRQVVLTIVLCSLIVGGVVSYKDYVQGMRDVRLTESHSNDIKELLKNIQLMSNEETKRMELLTSAISKNDVVQATDKEVEKFYKRKLKASTYADESIISGISLEADVAEELLKAKGNEPEPIKINGSFEILSIDWALPHTITLKRISDGIVVKARFDLNLLSG